MRLHKEGHIILLIVFVFSSLVNTCMFWLNQSWIWLNFMFFGGTLTLLVLLIRFFRHPERKIPTGENLIISPADGKIVVIEETLEPEILKEKCIQVSIFMSIHDVHCNRIPISGKVIYKKYHPGKYLLARHPKSSEQNERTSIAIESGKKVIVVKQIAGAVARRIKNYVKEEQQVKQGDELGFIKFGSRVDVFLPLSTRIKIQPGEKVKANNSVIGEW